MRTLVEAGRSPTWAAVAVGRPVVQADARRPQTTKASPKPNARRIGRVSAISVDGCSQARRWRIGLIKRLKQARVVVDTHDAGEP